MKHYTQCEVCKEMGFDDCKYCPKINPNWWNNEQKDEKDKLDAESSLLEL